VLPVPVWLTEVEAGVEPADELPATFAAELLGEVLAEVLAEFLAELAELTTELTATLEDEPEPDPEEITPPPTLAGVVLLDVLPAAAEYAARVFPDELFEDLVSLSNDFVLAILDCNHGEVTYGALMAMTMPDWQWVTCEQ
jgi:hypothetical protein